jgi:hypothetical protein
MDSTLPTSQLVEKWEGFLDSDKAGMPIVEANKRGAVAQMLENQLTEGGQGNGSVSLNEAGEPTNSVTTGGIDNYEPVLINLVRRMAPKMIAFDLAGLQPMKAPVQLIFALKSRYVNAHGAEALHGEADTAFSGAGTHAGTDPTAGQQTGGGMPTTDAEGSDHWNEMGFSIDKTNVEAKSRQLKATYSIEMATDLKNVHGLDADSELTNILQTEIIAEMNREFVRTVYNAATQGATTATTAGTFDLSTDADGRWSVEKYKGLIFQIDRDANAIAIDTRRGKGNVILCSPDVASALVMAGVLDYAPALQQGSQLDIDPAGTTYVGNYRKMYKVFIDPYATEDFYVIGYRGSSQFDAGIFYCPYVPLQQLRAQNQDTFNPAVGFKTRYGLVANPFTTLNSGGNVYYRKAKVTNIL